MRPVDANPESSRAATDRLLSDLAATRWKPHAWRSFLRDATVRSIRQARSHPRALGEVCALHAAFVAASRRTGRRWITASWTLCVLHLGMLESRPSLGMANILTLFRANLPATGTALGRWLGLVALATDFVDGRLARHTGTTTSFGRYADPLADTAYWTWHAFARGSGTARTAALLIWLTPATTVTVRSFHQGQMVQTPRPRWIRPAAALQIVLAADGLRSHPETKTGHRARRLPRTGNH